MAFDIPLRSGRSAQRPEMFNQWVTRFPTPDTALATAVAACANQYQGVHATHLRISKDESATVGARTLKSARNARAKLEPAVSALDKAITNAREAADQLRTKVTAAYRPPSPAFWEYELGKEIRQLAQRMNGEQLARALETAKENGDTEFLGAIAAYDARLTNCPRDLHRWARDELILIRAPEEAAQLANLGEQIGLASQFKNEMMGSVAELIDFKMAHQIELAAQADTI